MWLRVDDKLPKHAKSLALWKACGKKWELYALAVWIWRDMGCDCADRKSMGSFDRERVYREIRAPEKIIDKALDALVASGFVEKAGEDDFQYHDWTDYNPTKEELDEKQARISAVRAAAGSLGGRKAKELRDQQRGSKRAATEQQSSSNGAAKEEQGTSNGVAPLPASRTPESEPPPTPAVELAATGTDATRPNPEVVVDEPKATEPRTPEAKPAEPEAPAAQPERPLADVVTLLSPADRNAGEALAQAMATASGGMFDPLSGSTAKRAELYRRLKHYRVTPAEAVVMGECCAEPGKTWKWATTISNGFGLGFLLGSETAEGFSGDALSQLVQIARKRIAAVQRAALAKAEAAALPPPAPRKPPATPEELAAIRPSFARALAPVAPPATPTEVTHG